MTQFEQLQIERGNTVTLRGVSSFTPEGNFYSERVYKSRIQNVLDGARLKLELPVEYGDVVPLSLDMIYEIVIRTEEDTYRGRGRICSRYRDASGNSCIFQLTGVLSLDARKKFLRIDTQVSARYVLASEEDAGRGMITSFSMDFLLLETDRFLEERSKIRLDVQPDNYREIVLNGEIRESMRLRSGAFESEIAIEPSDIRTQKDLARWFLKHANDEEEKLREG